MDRPKKPELKKLQKRKLREVAGREHRALLRQKQYQKENKYGLWIEKEIWQEEGEVTNG